MSLWRSQAAAGRFGPQDRGVHVAQILNILESFDLATTYDQDPAAMRHLVAEAMKMAFADRAFWLGDPDYVNVPKGLIAKDYARQLAARIDRSKVVAVDSHGGRPSELQLLSPLR